MVLKRQTSHVDAKAIISSYLDKGWKLSTVKKVESTALAQPFCVNQVLRDLPQRLYAEFVIVRQFSRW